MPNTDGKPGKPSMNGSVMHLAEPRHDCRGTIVVVVMPGSVYECYCGRTWKFQSRAYADGWERLRGPALWLWRRRVRQPKPPADDLVAQFTDPELTQRVRRGRIRRHARQR